LHHCSSKERNKPIEAFGLKFMDACMEKLPLKARTAAFLDTHFLLGEMSKITLHGCDAAL